MLTRTLLVSALSGILLCGSAQVIADDKDRMQDRDRMEDQDEDRDRDRDRDQDRELIYGSQLMTPEERDAYRARLRDAATKEERNSIRREHHEQMKIRAQERGVTLPDEPMDRDDRGQRREMTPGMHPGGMGPGGMGPGGGGNR